MKPICQAMSQVNAESQAVHRAVSDASPLGWAVYDAVGMAVSQAVNWAVYEAVCVAVGRAVDRAVYDPAHEAVYSAVREKVPK